MMLWAVKARAPAFFADHEEFMEIQAVNRKRSMAFANAFIAARGIRPVLRRNPARDDTVSVETEQADASSLTAGGQSPASCVHCWIS